MNQEDILRRVTKDINMLLVTEEIKESDLKVILKNYFKEVY